MRSRVTEGDHGSGFPMDLFRVLEAEDGPLTDLLSLLMRPAAAAREQAQSFNAVPEDYDMLIELKGRKGAGLVDRWPACGRGAKPDRRKRR